MFDSGPSNVFFDFCITARDDLSGLGSFELRTLRPLVLFELSQNFSAELTETVCSQVSVERFAPFGTYDLAVRLRDVGGNEAEFGVGFPAGVDLCAIGPCQITNRSAAQLPDADSDGIPDDADNCPFDENPGQEDVDLDLLGDPCDPFPQRRDNDLAQCEEDVATCLANPAIPDADADGEPDVVDICPGSGSGPVDLGGCALDQFCARFSVTDLSGRRACRRADWQRDEGALFLARPRDCTVVTAGTPFVRSDDRCLPR